MRSKTIGSKLAVLLAAITTASASFAQVDARSALPAGNPGASEDYSGKPGAGDEQAGQDANCPTDNSGAEDSGKDGFVSGQSGDPGLMGGGQRGKPTADDSDPLASNTGAAVGDDANTVANKPGAGDDSGTVANKPGAGDDSGTVANKPGAAAGDDSNLVANKPGSDDAALSGQPGNDQPTDGATPTGKTDQLAAVPQATGSGDAEQPSDLTAPPDADVTADAQADTAQR